MTSNNIIVNIFIDFTVVDVNGVKKINTMEFIWDVPTKLGINTIAKDNNNNYYKVLFGQSEPDTIDYIPELFDDGKTDITSNKDSNFHNLLYSAKSLPIVTEVTMKSIFESLHYEEYFLINFSTITTELETKRENIKKEENDLTNKSDKLNKKENDLREKVERKNKQIDIKTKNLDTKEKDLYKEAEENEHEKNMIDTEKEKLNKKEEDSQKKMEEIKINNKKIEREKESLKMKEKELNKKVGTIGTNEKKDIREKDSDLSRKYVQFFISVLS